VLALQLTKVKVFGLLGGSGSGKTTLLREMVMLQKIHGGQMRVLGTNVEKASTHDAQKLREQWGILFQFGALFTSLTFWKMLLLPCVNIRIFLIG